VFVHKCALSHRAHVDNVQYNNIPRSHYVDVVQCNRLTSSAAAAAADGGEYSNLSVVVGDSSAPPPAYGNMVLGAVQPESTYNAAEFNGGLPHAYNAATFASAATLVTYKSAVFSDAPEKNVTYTALPTQPQPFEYSSLRVSK
jgi:hypothetical protein